MSRSRRLTSQVGVTRPSKRACLANMSMNPKTAARASAGIATIAPRRGLPLAACPRPGRKNDRRAARAGLSWSFKLFLHEARQPANHLRDSSPSGIDVFLLWHGSSDRRSFGSDAQTARDVPSLLGGRDLGWARQRPEDGSCARSGPSKPHDSTRHCHADDDCDQDPDAPENGREHAPIAVSYTHLPLPTNREV